MKNWKIWENMKFLKKIENFENFENFEKKENFEKIEKKNPGLSEFFQVYLSTTQFFNSNPYLRSKTQINMEKLGITWNIWIKNEVK